MVIGTSSARPSRDGIGAPTEATQHVRVTGHAVALVVVDLAQPRRGVVGGGLRRRLVERPGAGRDQHVLHRGPVEVPAVDDQLVS
ncbi:hypothetical protein [Micromonospora sicca]|uniref:hypothetical protein n=1 Tax=Micromonospora sicca TaxID=2202420 RepID=UPI001F3B50C8|nr:hypothetical protein [Micromonospora sp. 4G51]